MCVDYIGIPSPREPLAVTSPFTATFELPLEEAPDNLSLTVAAVTDADKLDVGPAAWQFWQPQNGESHSLPLTRQPEIELAPAPGLHLLSLFVHWEGEGDVIYGFLVQVE
jgi:hypothetical protein